ncbi:MAG: class I SAM-dependent methyltransferase [Microcoleus sp. CSU_2_2]|nr:class I SAM-dependent methyltransferase [Microcoleus sp. SU_5_3]NJS11965.1 class I SAM-dependent methyltransferase [Microcoleus sp. CSU_2_2]
MDGTITSKLGRLAGSFATHPEYIPRYLRDRAPDRSSPLEIELPWISYGAIDFLDGYLKPDMTVYEYGSGGSTLFFASRVAKVTSTEHQELWCDRVRAKLQASSANNVNLQLVECDLSQTPDFENSPYAQSIRDIEADVILIDGLEDWSKYNLRPICFAIAQTRIKKGGIIILDDSWRYTHLRQQNSAVRVQVFESPGPARPGVTSTDVYFY